MRTNIPSVSDEGPEEQGDVPSDTLLVAWSTVFPLSAGPTDRVRRHVGRDASEELVAAITADYVRELSERVPSPGRISSDGDLLGPPDLDGSPLDLLFTAVFTTDLDAIVQRHRART